MKIYLVRHGESEANAADLINDDPSQPVGLTERGVAQAEAVCGMLASVRFTHAYASEFPRARQTAEILIRPHNLSLNIDARLNERRSGMNGLPVGAFNSLMRVDPLHTKPEGGESFLEQMDRVAGFLDDIAVRHNSGIVLAVSHENPIVAALALSARDPEQIVRTSIANCGWVELDFLTV
jgi:broad specificity phosphatase PhoE